MKRILLFLFLITVSGILTGGDFVADSETELQIVLPEELPHEAIRKHLQAGADRLASALKTAFGKTVPVVRESSANPDRKTIYIGNTAKSRTLKLQPADGFNYCLAVTEDYVCIAGTDRPRLQKVHNPQRPAQEDFFLGSLRGIIDFTEKFLDTRYLWPGEIGTDYAKLMVLRIPAGITPRTGIRSALFVELPNR